MVRLAPRQREPCCTPFVDSKGNFGKVYSRDMAYAASRYTEAKLEPICARAVPRYRQGYRRFCRPTTTAPCTEPTLLPDHVPERSRHRQHLGIAVGMASNICSLQSRRGLQRDDRADRRPRAQTCWTITPRAGFLDGRRDSLRCRARCGTIYRHRPRQCPASAPNGAMIKEEQLH